MQLRSEHDAIRIDRASPIRREAGLAMAALGFVAEPMAVHALTIGVIGGMILGMMSHTARGHTGRPLQAGWPEIARFSLVFLSALVRVFGGMALPQA